MTRGPAVLVAGIGNVFFGDDGFGVEVVRRLGSTPLPAGVTVADYGIRGVHLAYDVLDGPPGCLVLVDALPRGEEPGTLTLLEVDPAQDGQAVDDDASGPGIDAHTMNPAAVLRALRSLGGHVDTVLVVGCEPAVIGAGIGLSAVVDGAVDDAVDMVREVAAAQLGCEIRTG